MFSTRFFVPVLALLPICGQAEDGPLLYQTYCSACHGAKGEGGIGPSFKGRKSDYISTALVQYKNKEERGAQSALMYAQAAALSDKEIKDLSEYITTL